MRYRIRVHACPFGFVGRPAGAHLAECAVFSPSTQFPQEEMKEGLAGMSTP